MAGQKTTQDNLKIAEIKDDTVVLKDGTIIAVILVSSINFSLKSGEEQEAIIQAYINFLNSFDFPIQIIIQSKKLNIDPYLEKLKKIEKAQTNELLRMQIVEYGSYVAELVKMGQIMTKKFYIVIPHKPGGGGDKKTMRKFLDVFSPGSIVSLKRDVFLRRRKELMHNADNIMSGISSMGLNSVLLDTQSLIEVYYNIYNPTTAPRQPLNLQKMQIEL